MKRVVVAAAAVLALWGLLHAFVPKPPLRDGVSLSRAVYSRDGRLLRLTLSSDDKYRLWLGLDDLSPVLKEATLLQEDRFFRWHPGVNPFSLARAAWTTYFGGDRRVGGSTITMQLARIRYGMDTRTPPGKLLQILRALQLELHYSKDEILEAYLNLAPYGLNIEGAGAAGLIYFNKRADALSLEQCLTLSVIPQNPSGRIRFYEDGCGAAEGLMEARERLLDRWSENHQVDDGMKQMIRLATTMRGPSNMPFIAPHFVYEVLGQSGKSSEISSTLDIESQRAMERVVKNYIDRKKGVGINNACVLLVDFRDMGIRGLVGSAGFFDDSIQGQVDGTSAKRSPGSTVKPFIYAMAMDRGLVHPMSLLKDAPTSFGPYSPDNFDHEFMGPLKVKDALVRSRNLPALQLAAEIGRSDVYDFLQEAGVAGLRERDYYGLSAVLGGAELTMEELVRMYAMLANGGVIRPLRMTGSEPVEEGDRLLSPEACFLTLDILRSNPRPGRGYSQDWTADPLPVAWKTGTSYAFRDAWSVGVFGPYVLAVWVGNFDGRGNPAFIGRDAAGPLFFQIVDALRSLKPDIRPVYDRRLLKLEKVKVCAVSGQIPGKYCKILEDTWFIPGKSPIQVCDIHREVAVDAGTGFRTTDTGDSSVKREVYEFWPSDILRIFQQAGIPRRTPPPWDPRLSLDDQAARGKPPRITSPQNHVVYTVRMRSGENERVPLKAVTDADSKEVFWFLDERYLGRSDNGEPFFWKPEPGSYVVRAVDDHGRSDSRDIQVALVN